MLWSVIKIVVFIAIVAVLTYGASLLLGTSGGIEFTFAGQSGKLGPLEATIALMVLVVAVWLFLKVLGVAVAVLKFLNGDETALSRYFDRNRERKGYQALSDGLMALASGEGKEAISKARKAERLLGKPELTSLLTAQAAELAGDRKAAEESYKKLVANDATRFVGVRGVMRQRLSEGDKDTALKLAEKGFALKPRNEEMQDVLLKLQAEKQDWSGARKTLGAKLKHGSLPRDVHKRRDAVLALSEARGILEEGKTVEAREVAIEANRKSPDLVPAAVLAAQSYVEQDHKRNAVRVIKKAWSMRPHPDLAAAFAAIEPEETPQARIKRFRALTTLKSDHPETKMLLAELHIAAEDFPEARRALGDLIESAPDARAATLVAAIERGEGASDTVVRGWLAKALTVPRGPQWVCDNCQHAHGSWAGVCENCGSFDTLTWRTPPTGEVVSSSALQMLPLVVGTLEEPKPGAEDIVDIAPKEAATTETEAAETTEPEENAGKSHP